MWALHIVSQKCSVRLANQLEVVVSLRPPDPAVQVGGEEGRLDILLGVRRRTEQHTFHWFLQVAADYQVQLYHLLVQYAIVRQ